MRLPDDLVTRWRLSDPQPVADTPTGTVWKVMQANGHPAALKLLRPGEV